MSTTRDLSALDPEMRRRVERRNRIMAETGVTILGLDTYRDPFEQARLYRTSRTLDQILTKKRQLTRDGFPFLANILSSVGPQAGKLGAHVTNAGPGESWHQYGLAQDACPVLRGVLLWDYDQRLQEVEDLWQQFGEACREAELVWAGDWVRMRERPHAQMPLSDAQPLELLIPAMIMDRAERMGWLRAA